MDKKEPCWTIYCHIHRESGRRYIGLTKKTWKKRWNSHVYNAFNRPKGSRSHFWAAIRKYGKDAFSHKVLEVCDSLEEANASEEYWIDLYGTTNQITGFNLAKGGSYVPNPEQKNPWDRPDYLWNDPEYRKAHGRKMKEVAKRPEVKKKRLDGLHAFIRSPKGDEWREKLRKANLGRPLTAEHREALAESSSRAQRKVPGYVSCGRHGLIPFTECFKAKSRTGRTLYRCKCCHIERCRIKIRELIAEGVCIACKKAEADAGTRCRPCANKRNAVLRKSRKEMLS